MIINPYRFAAAGALASRDFDSSATNWISVPDFAYSLATMTVMCWIKTNDTTDTIAPLGHYDINNQKAWIITFSNAANNGGTNFRAVVSGNAQGNVTKSKWATGSTGVISDGTWHHIAFTFDGGVSGSDALDLIVDANGSTPQSTLTNNTVTAIYNSTAPISIGAILSSGADIANFEGKLADVRIYDEVVSDANIATIYAGGDYTTNLVGRWITAVDDGDTTIPDYSINSNNGTNDGTTYSTDSPF